MPKTFLIFAGGLALSDATVLAVRKIEQVELVIAADSGLHAAQKLGLMTDVVIGDMDSVDTNTLAEAISHGAKIIRHTRDKNFTDTHAALFTPLNTVLKKLS